MFDVLADAVMALKALPLGVHYDPYHRIYVVDLAFIEEYSYSPDDNGDRDKDTEEYIQTWDSRCGTKE